MGWELARQMQETRIAHKDGTTQKGGSEIRSLTLKSVIKVRRFNQIWLGSLLFKLRMAWHHGSKGVGRVLSQPTQ